jgi:glycosyltransferase involved in cell wall biosynthesis
VKILHYLSGLEPSGAARSGVLLACGLAARGHRCRVVSGKDGALARDLRQAGVDLLIVAPPRHRLDLPRLRSVAAVLSADPPDLLHLNNLCLEGPLIARLARRRQIPVAWHVREDPDSRRARRLRRHLVRYARRVIAVSRQILDGLKDGEKHAQLVVIPNGIDPGPSPDRVSARRECGLGEGALWVGWLGRIVPRKGALDFLRAVAQARSAAPSARVLLAGRAGTGRADQRYLDELLRFLGSHPDLEARTLRLKEPEARPRLIEALDILAVPSAWEGCSRVILEGMRAGCAIVAYASGGTPELIEEADSGLLVRSGDVAGLAAAVERLAADRELARRLGEGARRRVASRFTLQRHLEEVEAIFRQAAAPGAS